MSLKALDGLAELVPPSKEMASKVAAIGEWIRWGEGREPIRRLRPHCSIEVLQSLSGLPRGGRSQASGWLGEEAVAGLKAVTGEEGGGRKAATSFELE